MTLAGFPHSGITGSQDACSSPMLFAAYHALHRLSVPRHPPCALVRLTGKSPGASILRATLRCPSTRLPAAYRSTPQSPHLGRLDSHEGSLPQRLQFPPALKSHVLAATHTLGAQPRPSIHTTLNPDCQRFDNRIEGTREKQKELRGARLWMTLSAAGTAYSRSLQKGGDPAAGSPTATLLRLRPSHRTRLRPLPPCGWLTDFGRSQLPWRDGRCVQGPGTDSPWRS
jgi:hypothetical protein